jgi:hypothetical protein
METFSSLEKMLVNKKKEQLKRGTNHDKNYQSSLIQQECFVI